MLKTLQTIFKGKDIKVFWDNVNQKYWFCAVDICKATIYPTQDDTAHKKAKSYWKTIKQRDPFFHIDKGYINMQMTMPAKDGKFYNTDVVDVATLLHMIKSIKHPNIASLRQWLKLIGTKQATKAINRVARKYAKKFITQLKQGKKRVLSLTRVVFGGWFDINTELNKERAYHRDILRNVA